MLKFSKKNQSKEINVAETPEEVKENSSGGATKKLVFFIWNVLSIALYSSYTLFVTYRLSEKNFLSKIIVYLLAAYAIVFVALILMSLGNRSKMKSRLKNYKSATSFFKYTIQIINFSLSIITAISAFITTGTTNVSAIIYAVLSLIITFFFVLFEIVKIIIRKNIPLIKYNFLEIRDRQKPKNNKKED